MLKMVRLRLTITARKCFWRSEPVDSDDGAEGRRRTKLSENCSAAITGSSNV